VANTPKVFKDVATSPDPEISTFPINAEAAQEKPTTVQVMPSTPRNHQSDERRRGLREVWQVSMNIVREEEATKEGPDGGDTDVKLVTPTRPPTPRERGKSAEPVKHSLKRILAD